MPARPGSWPVPYTRLTGKSLGKYAIPVILSKQLHLQVIRDAGGGTRTPDTGIMIYKCQGQNPSI
jgi:hypothetical protein